MIFAYFFYTCITHTILYHYDIALQCSALCKHLYGIMMVGCAFWGSDECVPSAPCLFFYLQSGCLSSSSSNETISRRKFSVSKLFKQHS